MYEVRLCKYGRGLFATRTIKKGETIATNHVVETLYTADPMISSYCFATESEMNCYIALGDISLINHNPKANCYVLLKKFEKSDFMLFHLIAQKTIKKGAQLFYDYGYTPRAK